MRFFFNVETLVVWRSVEAVWTTIILWYRVIEVADDIEVLYTRGVPFPGPLTYSSVARQNKGNLYQLNSFSDAGGCVLYPLSIREFKVKYGYDSRDLLFGVSLSEMIMSRRKHGGCCGVTWLYPRWRGGEM